jgi:hypothetical protein
MCLSVLLCGYLRQLLRNCSEVRRESLSRKAFEFDNLMRRLRQEQITPQCVFLHSSKLASYSFNNHRSCWCTREIKSRIAFVKGAFNKKKSFR